MVERKAVVTGASRGIGAAVVSNLAGNGYQVFGLARSVPVEPLTGVEFIVCDLNDADAITRVFAQIGGVDVLVNNAGVSGSDRVERIVPEEWDWQMALNVTAPFLCIREVLGGMRERDWGRIVSVSSTAGLEGSSYIAAYAASKHALMGLMRVVASEVGGSGITANTVCPTYVRTDMTVRTIENIVARTGCGPAEAEAQLAGLTPGGRLIEVEEVSSAVFELIEGGENGLEVVLDGR